MLEKIKNIKYDIGISCIAGILGEILFWISSLEKAGTTYALTYFLVAAATCFVLRQFQLSYIWSMIGAMAYDFLPFHYFADKRADVLCYFLIPFAVWVTFLIFYELNEKNMWLAVIIAALMAICSFQYTCFWVILLCPLIIVSLTQKNMKKAINLGSLVLVMGAVALIMRRQPFGLTNGWIPGEPHSLWQVKFRGVRLWAMVLPHIQHSCDMLRNWTADIYTVMDVRPDEYLMALGFFISAGLICSLVYFWIEQKDRILIWMSRCVLAIVLLAAVDGAAVLLSVVWGDMVWDYHRIIPVIAFCALCSILRLLQKLEETEKISIILMNILKISSICIILWDQIPGVLF